MTSSADPVFTTALTYERDAGLWNARSPKDRSPWQPSYVRFLPMLPPAGLILDLGCGSGDDAPAFESAGMRAIGLDISAHLLSLARAHTLLAGNLLRGDLRSLPFRSEAFDGIWADGTLHHVTKAELPAVLAEVTRVLRHGGAFAASVERGDGEGFIEGRGEVEGPRWYACYQPSELRKLFQARGLEVVDHITGGPSRDSANGFVALFARKP